MGFTSAVSDQEFIKLWKELGSPTLVGEKLGINPRSAMTRRKNIEIRYSIKLPTFNSLRDPKKERPKKIEQTPHNVRRGIDVNKVKKVIVFSDAHFTDTTTTAFKALIKMIDEFKPESLFATVTHLTAKFYQDSPVSITTKSLRFYKS